MIMNYVELGRRVRQQRSLCGMTQEELAEKTGISCSFVGHIERGEKKFSIGTLVSLCNAMGVSPNYLLQDSLNADAINEGVDVGKENKALFDGMMALVHEYNLKMRQY